MDSSKLSGLKEIHEYLKKHYETIDNTFSKFDTKLVLIFTVLGVMLSFASALIPHFLYITDNENVRILLYIILTPLIVALIFVYLIFYEFMNLFFTTHPVPGISGDLEKVEALETIDEAQIIELFINFNDAYRTAIKAQDNINERRKGIAKKLRIYYKVCFAFLLATLIFLLIARATIIPKESGLKQLKRTSAIESAK